MVDVAHEKEASGELRRATGPTLHICAWEHWIGQNHQNEYEPEQFAQDGFVHCTDDASRLMEIANCFYQHDLRPYVALEIDLDAVSALAIYEDEANEFPHIYGRVPLSSIRRKVLIERADDGTFLHIAGEADGTNDRSHTVD